MPPPSFRLANLVRCSLNLRRKSIRSLVYTACSDGDGDGDASDRSSDASVLRQLLGKFKRERSSALLFERHLKESGFKHDVETYMAIVRLLCDSRMDERLNNLFMHVIENIVSVKVSNLMKALIDEKLIKAVEVLVKLYATVGRFREAMDILSEMKSKGGVMVSTPTFNFVMKELIEWGEVDKIEYVYKELQKNGVIPNVYTYGILIKGLFLKGRLQQIMDLNDQMEVAGIQPNASIVGMHIHELCLIRKTDLAFHIVKELSNPVDAFTYACLIRGFVKEWKLQEAEDVFLDMKLREVVPDANCYGALLLGYHQKGDTAKALDLRKEMETRGINADCVVARSMMQRLSGLGRFGEALCKFKGFMQNGVFLDGVTFNIAIDAACKLGRMEDAMGLLEEMKSRRKMKPLNMHYGSLMNGYCNRVEPWNAIYMFQEMMRIGLRPDSTTYHVLARGGVFLPLYMLFK